MYHTLNAPWQVHGPAVQQAVMGQGEGLMRALLRALCDSGPRRLLRALSSCLFHLLVSPAYADAALTWLISGLRSPDLPGVFAGLSLMRRCICE